MRAAAGSLEQAVLTVLWDEDGWLAPRQVQERLNLARPLGYATVTTVLVRLWGKGRLERQKRGRSYAYRARETREQFVARRMDEILGAAADRSTALAYFAGSLSDDDRAELRRKLAAEVRQ